METITSVRSRQIQVSSRTTWTFVELATSEGRVGTGEASVHYGQDEIVAQLNRLASVLTGRSARRKSSALPSPCGANLPEVAAICAVDQALFDLEAQRLGRSIAAVLVEELRHDIVAYANINRRTSDRSPGGFAASAAAAVAAGMSAVKIAPFDRVRPPMSLTEARPLLYIAFDRIAAVRDAIGPNRALMVDCHWRLNSSMVEDVVRAAAENALFWIETPLPEDAEQFDAIRYVRAHANAAGVRVAGGELKVDLAGFLPIIGGELYDVVMPDMTFVGGYDSFMRVAEAAAAKGMWVSPHNPTGPICHAHSVQVSAAIPNFLQLEMQFDETPLFGRIVEGSLPMPVAGRITVPRRAGLDLRLIAECDRAVSL